MSVKEMLAAKRAEIVEIADRYGASEIRLFGSAARGEETAGSDIDLLVQMRRGSSLLDVIGLEMELSEFLGAKVDVQLEGGLSPYLEKSILQEACAI